VASTLTNVSDPTVVPSQPSNPTARVTPAAGWEHYTNSRWGYSLARTGPAAKWSARNTAG